MALLLIATIYVSQTRKSSVDKFLLAVVAQCVIFNGCAAISMAWTAGRSRNLAFLLHIGPVCFKGLLTDDVACVNLYFVSSLYT